jgi:hypothetical protein
MCKLSSGVCHQEAAHCCHLMVHISAIRWCTFLSFNGTHSFRWLVYFAPSMAFQTPSYPSSTLLLSLSLPCTHQPDDNVHIGAATYENISAISNATSCTPDEKEKCWSPTHYSVPYEKIPTPLLDGSKVPVHNPNSSNCTQCNYLLVWFLANLWAY